MLWHIELKFCIWLWFTVLKIKFKCRQFLWELCPFWNLEYWKYTVFRTFLLHDFTYWAEILHMTLFYCTKDQVRVSSIFVGVMPLLELRILEIHSFPHFSLTCFDILSWNFAYDFLLLYYRSSSSVVNLRQFLWELCPSWNLEYWKYTVFCTFSYMNKTNHPISSNSHPSATTKEAIFSLQIGGGYKTNRNII